MNISDTDWEAIKSLVRALLVCVGAVLVNHGVTTNTDWQSLVGSITAALPIMWGMWNKYQLERAAQDREHAAVNVGIALATSGTAAGPVPRDVALQAVQNAPTTTPGKGP